MLLETASISWVDIAFGFALLISVLIGIWRGLIFEVLSLAGWIVAFVAAQMFGDEVARWIPIGVRGDALNHGAAIAITFFGTLLVWGLVSRVVRMMIRATPLSSVDRVLGAVFGVLRGAILALIVATVVLMTPAARSREWQFSLIAPLATSALKSMKPYLPAQVIKHLPPEVGSRA